MRYTITEMWNKKFWVTSYKAHLGWETLDGVYDTLEQAEADCDKAGGGYTITDYGKWWDAENDYKSYRQKEIDYDYLA